MNSWIESSLCQFGSSGLMANFEKLSKRSMFTQAKTAPRWSILLYPAYLHIADSVRSNRVLFQFLFGFRPLPASCFLGQYWDWTTLALKRVLDRQFRPGMTLLDMGTGPTGVLAIYAARRLRPAAVVAADHVAEVVAAAALQVESSGCKVRTVHSNLFGEIPEVFDCIVFNAPYLVNDRARRLGLMGKTIDAIRFGGGGDGCDTISRFLRSLPAHLSVEGWAALGVNHFHLAQANVAATIARSGLKLIQRLDMPFLQSSAYVLQRP